MKHQSGSAHVYVVAILVVALIAALGFIFWQNFIKADGNQADQAAVVTETSQQAESADETAETPQQLDFILNSREVTVDVSDSKYDDVETSFNEEGGYYDVYSVDLLARINASNNQPADYKGCNSTVTIDTFEKDSAAGIYQSYGDANGKSVHVGFMGPCQPSSDEALNDEIFAFRDYLQGKVSEALK
jgi:type II secretory pathway pseudopilin PulG